jgi:aspartyl-tRNA(Asn)/glutamyl-tRNA(Gln) amidotransferase subunit A
LTSERILQNPVHRESRRGGEYDPRVRMRIERGGAMTAVEYLELCAERADLIARVAARTADFDALLRLTVAITAPPIAPSPVTRIIFGSTI